MAKALKDVLAEARRQSGLSLRDVEEKTGIKNAHVSQLETGAITRPAPNILWTLANFYDLEFQTLLRLAGYTKRSTAGANGEMFNAAFRAMDRLSPADRAKVLEYAEKLGDRPATK